jgi:N utilization substance protein A
MSALVGGTSTPLDSVPGLGEGLIEKLSAAGVTTVEDLADMTPEQLEAIEGIGPKTVEKISLAVNNYFSSLEGGETATASPEAVPETAAEGEVLVEQAAGESSVEAPLEGVDAAAEAQPLDAAEAAAVDETAAPATEAVEEQAPSGDQPEAEK